MGPSGAKKGQVGLGGAKHGLARLWSQAGLSMLRGPSGAKLGLAGLVGHSGVLSGANRC